MWNRRSGFASLVLLVVAASAASAATERQPASTQPTAPAAAPAQPTPAPATLPATSDLRVTLDMRDESVRAVLEAIAEQTGLSLIITDTESVDEHLVALRVKNLPVDEILPTLADESGLTIEHRGSTLVVTSKDSTSKRRGHHRIPRPPAPPPIPSLPLPSDRSFTIDLDGDGKHHMTGNVTIEVGSDERFAMGSDAVVEAGKTVSEATVIGGTLTVRGHVEGDAVAVGGSVHLEPGATVDGDVVAVAGWITTAKDAQIGGDAVSVGGLVQTASDDAIGGDRIQVGGRIGGVLLGLIGIVSGAPFGFGLAMQLMRAALFLGAAVLLVTYWPARVASVRGYLVQRPGLSVLAGVALAVGVLPICFVLMLTLVGIPLVPVVLAGVTLLYIVGTTALAAWIGDKLPFFRSRKTPLIAVLLGVAVLALVKAVPYFGTLVALFASIAATGAAVVTRAGQPPAAPPPVVPPAPPAITDLTPTLPSDR